VAYNAGLSMGGAAGTAGTPGTAGTAGTAGAPGKPGTIVAPGGDPNAGGMSGNTFYDDVVEVGHDRPARGGDCSLARGGHPLLGLFGASLLGALLARRRRRS